MMSSSSSIFCFILLLLFSLYSAGANDCIALRQFVDSFTITEEASRFCYPQLPSHPKTTSWNNVTDCCTWDGVTCGNGEAAVIGIDLSCSWLQGSFDSNSSLFSLRSLTRLNLAGNNFEGSEIPSTFRVFLDMTHLNLAGSFGGYIPREVAHLSKLESLDLSVFSDRSPLLIEDNVLKSIMQNLTRLRRLSLDHINLFQASSPSPFVNLSTPSLNYLSLSHCGLDWSMFSELFRLPKLEYLDLSGNNVYSTSWSLSDNWTSPLRALDLSVTNSVGRLLEKIVSLKTLHYLNLQWNPIVGEIPASIGNLTALEYLDLSETDIGGSLPSTFANLQQLSYLNLRDCDNMSGVVDFEVFANMRKMGNLRFPYNKLDVLLQDGGNGSFPELTKLTLRSCNLTKFPYFLSSSKGLQHLDLSDNMITGPIPRWLWSLGNDTLEQLILSDNLITGVLNPFPWKKVTSVEIQNNLLSGELQLPPSGTIMDEYNAYNNNFTGIIPSSVCQLSQLWSLFLSDNQLSGTIPDCISNLTSLFELDVSSNHLDGPLPRSLSNCTMLYYLILGHNRINDTFPDWLQSSLLLDLDLQSNDFNGPVRIDGRLQFEIITCNLADNAFTGHWPANYFLNSTPILKLLDLSKNNFVGPIPVPSPDVQYYDVSDNNFTGEIPAVICDATGLEIINLSNNSLVGGIPPCLANSVSLSVLNLRNNKLIGKIPRIFGRDNRLRTVDLSQNNLSGRLTRSLKNCKHLEVFDISNNAIEDVFPSWLAVLPELQVLVLRSNRFYGPIHYHSRELVIHPFRQLRIFDISVNRFSGPLPTKYMAKFKAMMDYSERGNLRFVSYNRYKYDDSVRVVMKGHEIELVKILKVFTTIDLSANFFKGEFPGLVGNLKALKGLNFSHNNITGNISPSVGNLSELEWLDLSSNKLSGEIPPGMAALTFLTYLNLSMNRLTGQIPIGNQFNTFSSNAFEGNPGLCGFPLPKAKACGSNSKDDQQQPPKNGDEEDEGEDWIEWKAVPVGYIFGIVFGFTLGYYYLSVNS